MSIYYDVALVLLSILVAILASYVALDLTSRVAATRGSKQAKYWLVGGSLSMGVGIWSMHFIGMLAAHFSMPISYDIPITLLSMVIAIVVSGFALHTVSRTTLRLHRLLMSGTLMGIGIAGMHYTGMAAMQMVPGLRYDPFLFGLSIAIAIAASIAALWISFRLRSQTVGSAFWQKTGSAVVMGVAIAGMHYTGMFAVILAPDSVSAVPPQNINNVWLGGMLGGFSLIFLAMSLILSSLDARNAERAAKDEVIRANEKRVRAIIQHSHDAFVGITADGKITDWNDQAERTFGWKRAEVMGRNFTEIIIPERYRQSQTGVPHFPAAGDGILHQRTELQGLRRNGEEFPMELTIGTAPGDGARELFAFMRDISERKEANRKLLFMAQNDPLTSLPNRSLFHERLSQAMARSKRTRRLMAVMYLDIDRFKSINDTLGHIAGDELLKAFAARLRASVRDADTVARLGGDEFTVLAEELPSPDDVAVVASKIIENVAQGFAIASRDIKVTTSIGIALYRGEATSHDELIIEADQALYRAKKAGRNIFKIAKVGEEPTNADSEETSRRRPAGGAQEPAPDTAVVTTPPVPLRTTMPGFIAGAERDDTTADDFLRQVAKRGDGTFDTFLREALAAIRTHLQMEVAFISEFIDGQRVFRYIDSLDGRPPIKVGGSDPLEDSYCQRVVEGRLPELIPDAFDVPAAKELPATAALPVRAHVSVPIRLEDGSVYGTFCCFSSKPDRSLNERDLEMMRIFAGLTARQIGRERAAEKVYNQMRRRIQSVLSSDRLSVVYQPIYDLEQRKIAGFEALSRFMVEPNRSPDVWFEEAARVGLGIELEISAIKRALAGLQTLPPDVYVTLNLSPDTIVSGELERALDGVPFDQAVLEITEHRLIDEYMKVESVLRPLRSDGLRLAVDDAGAGYASFRHILKLAPDIIKLDMSLTRNIDTNRSCRALASALIRFAAETGSTVVAEGVETDAELHALRELGVVKMQGYLLGRPMTIESAARLCRSAADAPPTAKSARL